MFLSSYRVFAGNSPLTESSPRLLDVSTDLEFLRTDEYSLHKAREENLLRDSSLWNWTILRPSITYSKERFQFGCLEADAVCYRSLQGLPVVMPSEMLDVNTTMTWAGDVAKLVARLVLNPFAYGEDFNVVTSETHTWREVADIYRRAIGLEVHEVAMGDYLRICDPYQVQYDRMFDRRMDNSKVLKVTSMRQEEFMPLAQGLINELSEFKKMPHYQWVNLCQNARMDRICKTRIELCRLSRKQQIDYLRQRYKSFDRILGFAGVSKRMVTRLLGGD